MADDAAVQATVKRLDQFLAAEDSGSSLETPLKVVVCGGGNASHVFAGVLGSHRNLSVSLYSALEREVEAFRASQQDGISITKKGGDVVGKLAHVTSDASEVVPDADMIIVSVPAFAHEAILTGIAPHVRDGAVVGAVSARAFFDLALRDKLGEERASKTIAFTMQMLPWACRITEYAKAAQILGFKAEVDTSVTPHTAAPTLTQVLGRLCGLQLDPVEGGFITITLANQCQLIHPGITYGCYAKDWDGKPLKEKPLFYQGVDDFSAEVLTGMSDELVAIRDKVQAETGASLREVYSLKDWLLKSYDHDIADKTSLKTCFNTNAAYRGLTHPMIANDDGTFCPDFSSRYLTEDVPYGLVPTIAIARLAGVPTPTMDKVCTWAQDKIGMEFLVGSEPNGKDIDCAQTPQRYGITTLAKLFEVEAK